MILGQTSFFPDIGHNIEFNLTECIALLHASQQKMLEDASQNIENALEYKKKIPESRFKDFVIVGMGGAILNPRALLEAMDVPNFHFIDSTDTAIFDALINNLDLKSTKFFIISKSGNTIETLELFKALYGVYKSDGIENIKSHFCIITSYGAQNQLAHLPQSDGVQTFEHEKSVSGRFASFSNICIVPAIFAGLDITNFIDAAKNEMHSVLDSGISHPAIQAGIKIALQKKYNISINISYSDSLQAMLWWYAQMISESLGKSSLGITPITARGPMDHHSQVQLYLDGAHDKFFNLFVSEGTGHTHPSLSKLHNSLPYALMQSLEISRLPFRTFKIKKRNEGSIGKLMMHIITEIITIATLYKINPFDQPSVAILKKQLHEHYLQHL